MRALAWDSAAARMTVEQAPAPRPAAGQVLARVHASAINEMDVEIRAGGWAEYVPGFLARGPVVTGFEFAGVAATDGERIKAGDRIIGYTHVLAGPRTHAELVAVDENDVAAIPEGLGFPEAAALVSMGLTAIEILEGLKPLGLGQRALVLGAAGGVGVYTVQLARHQGAHVTAVCSEANEAWVRAMGADEVRPYETTEAMARGDGFDLIVDTPAKWSFERCLPFLSPTGMYVTTNPFADPAGFEAAATVSPEAGHLLMLSTAPDKLARLAALWSEGALRPAIDSIHPLEAADAAFNRIATRGKQGRVILQIAD
jgi:NADPH:quinone reductase